MLSQQELYVSAREHYASIGVDTESALACAQKTAISLHCWQGDDVRGFESSAGALTGGIQTTGGYPGAARNFDELTADLGKALSLAPGTYKISIHANYISSARTVDRDALEPEDFAAWADWACRLGLGLDFNSTFFSHPLSENGTLTSADKAVRDFWIAHAIASRRIADYLGQRTQTSCLLNHWIPDGGKEVPADTLSPRLRLKESLNTMLADKSLAFCKDSVESKLFGIGSESYVPGSHEFYLGYAVSHPGTMLTLDAGHFHPTEVISAKISSVLCFLPEIMLHVSRPVRWDSDHVVLLDDETRAIMHEIISCRALDRVHIGTDYFDASINRVAAWVLGARSTRKALLFALLEPIDELRRLESEGDNTGRLALWQSCYSMPFGAVWNELCARANCPDARWIHDIRDYERAVLASR